MSPLSPPATPPRLPHVAVLLLNWNGWRDTLECLESVLKLDYPRMTVVLCDNASTDESVREVREWARGASIPDLRTPDALRQFVEPRIPKPVSLREYSRAEAEAGGSALTEDGVVLIHNGANLGFAGGNNTGLRFLSHHEEIKYVWILNNDIVVAPDSL